MAGNNVNLCIKDTGPKLGHESSQNAGADCDFNADIIFSNQHDGPSPFRLIGAAANPKTGVCSPVIVSCPHSGRFYPEELITAGSVYQG